jgi:hypothetical protein
MHQSKSTPEDVVVFAGFGGCSNCKADKSMEQQARRTAKKVAAGTTARNEKQTRRAVGLPANMALHGKKRAVVTWASATPMVWHKLWFYYWERFGGGVPPRADKRAWKARFEALAIRLGICAEGGGHRGSSGDRVERLYAYLHSQCMYLLESEHRKSPHTKDIDFSAVCGRPWL